MDLEKWIKPHGECCLAGKYSTMGRCSCGRDVAIEELHRLQKVAKQSVQASKGEWMCRTCRFVNVHVEKCSQCGSKRK